MKNYILLRNNLVEIDKGKSKDNIQLVGTLVSNLLHYGFLLSNESLSKLSKLDEIQLKIWWKELEPALKKITGDDKNIGEHVVYKNFPDEVLNMSEAQYWFNQILMYWGVPNEYFTTDKISRNKMFEKVSLKILHCANSHSLENICLELLKLPVKWNAEQQDFIDYLSFNERLEINFSIIPFKENLVYLLTKFIENNMDTVVISSATDVLRLAIGVSGGDISMKEKSKFKCFSRKYRKFFLKLLDKSSNLEEDIARDKEKWKKFLYALHPGDYKDVYKNVCKCYDKLYNNNVQSFAGRVEELISKQDKSVLKLLETRPGDYLRKFYRIHQIFGDKCLDSFNKILPKLTVIQLLKFRCYVNTISTRKQLTVAPKGNWAKLKIFDNKKSLPLSTIDILNNQIHKNLKLKLKTQIKSVKLFDCANKIKLQTNDSVLCNYGRGTEFDIPDNINFIRSASYWQHKTGSWYSCWFDNGWIFFDENWKSKGVCCWTHVKYPTEGYSRDRTLSANTASAFSGDPTNSKTKDGKACQLIDLYLDKLKDNGVRYAVWNILCFSRIKFSDAHEVFAALQWGEDAKSGELFEPARCQLSFPITDNSFTKYIALIDIQQRKLVYLDANLKSSTHTAHDNQSTLEGLMPAYMEYLNTLPSVYNLFEDIQSKKSKIVVSYSDKDIDLDNTDAYIFRPENEKNKFKQLKINELLNVK